MSDIKKIRHNYEQLRGKEKWEIKRVKRKEDIRVAPNCKENFKEFFELVNGKKSVKNSISLNKDMADILQYKDIAIANILNEYFASEEKEI